MSILFTILISILIAIRIRVVFLTKDTVMGPARPTHVLRRALLQGTLTSQSDAKEMVEPSQEAALMPLPFSIRCRYR